MFNFTASASSLMSVELFSIQFSMLITWWENSIFSITDEFGRLSSLVLVPLSSLFVFEQSSREFWITLSLQVPRLSLVPLTSRVFWQTLSSLVTSLGHVSLTIRLLWLTLSSLAPRLVLTSLTSRVFWLILSSRVQKLWLTSLTNRVFWLILSRLWSLTHRLGLGALRKELKSPGDWLYFLMLEPPGARNIGDGWRPCFLKQKLSHLFEAAAP